MVHLNGEKGNPYAPFSPPPIWKPQIAIAIVLPGGFAISRISP